MISVTKSLKSEAERKFLLYLKKKAVSSMKAANVRCLTLKMLFEIPIWITLFPRPPMFLYVGTYGKFDVTCLNYVACYAKSAMPWLH